MKNIICIDLTKYNNEKLSEIVKIYNLSEGSFISNKKLGFVKLYVDTANFMIIAHTHKDNRNEIVISDFFKDSIKTIEPIEIKKKNKTLKILTVDNILDKISKYGIESLSDVEKVFLNENSNNI
jgi:hypothetical protein